jgi:hypothetical protein
MRYAAGASLLLVLAITSSSVAQDAGDQACGREYSRLNPDEPVAVAQACDALAGWLVDTLATRISAPPTGALQSRRAGEASAAGTTAQTEAVPSVQPTALASASLGVAGSDAGTDALTSISLNPAALLAGIDPESAAKWGRFSDVTLYFPVTDAGDVERRLDYFGARVRINMTGIDDGDAILEQATAAFNETLRAETMLFQELKPALKGATNLEQCVRGIMESEPGDEPGGCGGDLTLSLSPQAYRELRERFAEAREKADERYLGLDLRVETGDPTLGAVADADLTALQAGIAFGRRFLQPNVYAPTLGVRTRLGLRYTDPRDPGLDVTWALDGGLGFDASRLLPTDQYLRLSGGFEFRFSNSDESEQEPLQTDMLTFRGSLSVPVVSGASLAIGFATPVVGDTPTSLTFNVDWGLLLPGLGSLARRDR